jgi:antitoxin component YwqK of YwqJK toxin-antitoxin module
MSNEISPFYENGLPRFRGEYLEGEMHGPWEFYRKDGSLMRSGEFDKGVQTGIWRTFDRAGKLVSEKNF